MAENPELDGQSKVGAIIGLSVGFATLSTVVVWCRIHIRVNLKSTGIDDAAIIVAQVLAVGLSIVTCVEAYYGLGRHSWVLSHDEAIHQLKALFAAIQIYIWALYAAKVALLLQYRRVFNGALVRHVSFALIIFSSIWNIVQSILVSLACIPLSIFITSLADECLDSLTIWYISAAFNITADFCVLLLPLPSIKSLQLPLKQKLLLSAVLCMGLFTCIVSIARAFTLSIAAHATDTSWAGVDAAVWSLIEAHTAILCSCLPTLRPLIRRLMPSLLSSQRPSEHGYTRSASKSAYVKQRSFPGGSTEGLRDPESTPKNEFGKSKTCITKCSTGHIESPFDDDNLELVEIRGSGQSAGIMVKTEMVVREEVGLSH